MNDIETYTVLLDQTVLSQLRLLTTILHVDISKKQPGKSGLRHSMGIFATGVVYGCNPDALFCVIPAITLPTKLAAATYTAMFVLGTVGAMGGYTAFIGQPCRLCQLYCLHNMS